jgi:hypothetical protein
MKLNSEAIARHTYTVPYMATPLAEQDLGFFLYCQMARLVAPDTTDESLKVGWNHEERDNRLALRQVAEALGSEAVERYKKSHLQ